MNTHDYLIIIHPDEDGGFWTEVPALSGCGSQGEKGGVDFQCACSYAATVTLIASVRSSGGASPCARIDAMKP